MQSQKGRGDILSILLSLDEWKSLCPSILLSLDEWKSLCPSICLFLQVLFSKGS